MTPIGVRPRVLLTRVSVRSFLVAAWAARAAAVAARELAAEPDELLVEPEPDPPVACVRVRSCKRARDAVAAGPESGVRICAECHSRRQAADMLQCPLCVRWFHRACGGVRSVPVPLDWSCSASEAKCCAAKIHKIAVSYVDKIMTMKWQQEKSGVG